MKYLIILGSPLPLYIEVGFLKALVSTESCTEGCEGAQVGLHWLIGA